MITTEDIKPGLALTGLEPGMIVTVIAAVPIGTGAAQVIYKLPDGTIRERMISMADISTVAVATSERPWSFDGDGEAFKLAVEAKRIDLAFLFDPMMAVHTSNVEPLPHQITAVYESMLPRQPLRFVLADDPGAGKTIMAGLYIRELIMRADSRRILVVAPGSLVEQWRDELFEKFGLQFNVFSAALEAATPTGNPFEDLDHLIVRLDQMARNEELQEKLLATTWDLVIFDEAHKLSAHFFGSKLEKTGRFLFAEKLGARTRHLLLLTATPHNGKDEDFQLFLSLLDSDRFYGKFRGGGDGAHKVDASDLMRRMVKEEMLRFDGTRLFPERKAGGTTRKDARDLLSQRLVEVRQGVYVRPVERERLAEERRLEEAKTAEQFLMTNFLDQFLREYSGRKGSDHYSDVFKYVSRGLGDRVLTEITRADLELFVADLRSKPGLKGRALSDSTIRKVISVTKTVFKWAVERGDLPASPAVGIKKPAEAKNRTRYLSRDEWSRLESTTAPWLRSIFTLAVMTGMRLGEIALLKWSDVDVKASMLHVPTETKTGTRPIPLNGSAMAVINDLDKRRRENAKITSRLPEYVCFRDTDGDLATEDARNRLSRAGAAAMVAAGIQDATFHTLRHTAASWMVAAGIPLYEVGKILGHSTPMMTQRYAHLAPEQLRNAVSALDAPQENAKDSKRTLGRFVRGRKRSSAGRDSSKSLQTR